MIQNAKENYPNKKAAAFQKLIKENQWHWAHGVMKEVIAAAIGQRVRVKQKKSAMSNGVLKQHYEKLFDSPERMIKSASSNTQNSERYISTEKKFG